MNWLGIAAKVAGNGAKLLGSVLGGSSGEKVGALVAHALGVDPTADSVAAALEGNPDAYLKLRELELTHQTELQKLALAEYQAQLGDIHSARLAASTIQTGADVPWYTKSIQPGLAIFGVGLTFFLFWWFVHAAGGNEINPTQKDIIIYILGILSAVVTQIYSFYFGSSHGSARKTDMLAKGKDGE